MQDLAIHSFSWLTLYIYFLTLVHALSLSTLSSSLSLSLFVCVCVLSVEFRKKCFTKNSLNKEIGAFTTQIWASGLPIFFKMRECYPDFTPGPRRVGVLCRIKASRFLPPVTWSTWVLWLAESAENDATRKPPESAYISWEA